MSRSRRHTPIIGIAGGKRVSEKDDKKRWHKEYRAAVKLALKAGKEPPHFREHSNPWSFAKDGKVWMSGRWFFRGDPDDVMRK